MFESHIWSGKYGIQSMICVTPRFLAPPTTTWMLWRWQLYCMAPPKKSNREELDDSAEATFSSNTSELEGQIYGACNKRQRRWAVPRRVQSTPRAPHWRKRTLDGCTGLPGPILLRVCVATGPVTSPHFPTQWRVPWELTWSKLDQQRLVP